MHKCQVFYFTLVCRFKSFEFTAIKFSCLDSHLHCCPWMLRKSSKIHCLWSAFLVWYLEFCMCWHRFMLTDFRHPPMLFRLRVCLPWATSMDSNLFMPTVQWDEAGFINWYILHSRCWDADLLTWQTNHHQTHWRKKRHIRVPLIWSNISASTLKNSKY